MKARVWIAAGGALLAGGCLNGDNFKARSAKYQQEPPRYLADGSLDPDQVICKVENQGPGTIMPTQTCGTRAEWERRAQRDGDNAATRQRRSGMSGDPLGG